MTAASSQQVTEYDILVRWLGYADDICALAECKEELTLNCLCFNSVLTEYGMELSAEKSFWMSPGCTVDTSDRGAM